MRLESVRLANIKSYSDATVPFADGVTFVSGLNGAGKSTILEAIGYALFDWTPARPIAPYLVRRGQSTGEIRVRFEGNDERMYEVRRQVGARTRWEVWDLATELPIDLHGAADVIHLLRGLLGIEPDWKMDEIFTQVLSVEQGQFTAPFLQPEAYRRATFDPIFKLDAYRSAWTKSGQGERALDDERHRMELDIAANLARLEGYEGLVAQIEADRAIVETRAAEVDGIRQGRDAARDALAALRARKDRYDELHRQADRLAERIADLAARIADFDARIASADEARTTADRLRAEFERAEALATRAAELERLLAGRAEAENRKAELETEIAGLASSIDERARQVAERRETLTARLTELECEIAAAEGMVASAEASRSDAAKALAAWERVETAWAATVDWIGRLDGYVANVRHRADEARTDAVELARLDADAAEAAIIEPEARALPEIRQRCEDLRREAATVAERREVLVQYRKIAVGKTCPFFGKDCPVVTGTFGPFFDGQLSPLDARIAAVGDELAQAESELATTREADERWRALCVGLDRRETVRAKIGDRLAALSDGLRELVAAMPAPIAELDLPAPDTIEAPDGDAESFAERVAAWRTAWTRWRKRAEGMIRKTTAQRREQLAAAEREIATADAARSRWNAERARGRGELDGLGDREASVAADRGRMSALDHELAAARNHAAEFDRHEAERRQVAADRRTLEPAHAEYLDAAARAKGRDDLIGAREADVARRAETAGELSRCRDALVEFADADLPAEVRTAERTLETHERAFAAAEAELAAARKRIDERTAERDRLDAIRVRLEEQRGEMRVLERAQALFRAMRTVLNRAAEPIAERYRESISLDANGIYRQISGDSAELGWGNAYEIELAEQVDGVRQTRTFRQLSGGEQMSAALAVRLALMRSCSTTGIGMFDEPTMNLDEQRRMNLAKAIPAVAAQGFRQLVVISHDDTFDALSENVVRLERTPRGTAVREGFVLPGIE